MSYDFNFWRYKRGVNLDHQLVYVHLCDGVAVEGLEDIPSDEMLSRVCEEFSDWKRLDDVTFDGGERGGFQLYFTPQIFRVDCYGLEGEVMNKFIDIASEFQCPLYDPQVNRRFDGS
jgi:hypothetical protein